jgi:hypothetical protein
MKRVFSSPLPCALSIYIQTTHSQSTYLLFTIPYEALEKERICFHIYSPPFLDQTSFSVTTSLCSLYLHPSEKLAVHLSAIHNSLKTFRERNNLFSFMQCFFSKSNLVYRHHLHALSVITSNRETRGPPVCFDNSFGTLKG